MMLQRTRRCILINNLFKRNHYNKDATVIGSNPDKSLPDYQVLDSNKPEFVKQ